MKKLLALLISAALTVTMTATFTAQEDFMLGDVNGDGVIDMYDALELLSYLGNAPSGSVIKTDERAREAARVLGNSTLSIHDALEILKFMNGLNSAIEGDGNNPDRIPFKSAPAGAPINAVINIANGTIAYYAATELSDQTINIMYTVEGEEVTFFRPVGNNNLPGNSQSVVLFNSDRGTFSIGVIIDGTVSAGTVLFTQEFEYDTVNDPNAPHTIKIDGAGLEGVILNDGNDGNDVAEFSILDALNILRDLAKIQPLTDAQIEKYDFFGNGNISIINVLEILKFLAKMDSMIVTI
jgi:hypothetical protein